MREYQIDVPSTKKFEKLKNFFIGMLQGDEPLIQSRLIDNH